MARRDETSKNRSLENPPAMRRGVRTNVAASVVRDIPRLFRPGRFSETVCGSVRVSLISVGAGATHVFLSDLSPQTFGVSPQGDRESGGGARAPNSLRLRFQASTTEFERLVNTAPGGTNAFFLNKRRVAFVQVTLFRVRRKTFLISHAPSHSRWQFLDFERKLAQSGVKQKHYFHVGPFALESRFERDPEYDVMHRVT